MKHTKLCKLEQVTIRRQRMEYKECWPDYCKGCGGSGKRTHGECGKCVKYGFCPRCHFLSHEHPLTSCPICQWDLDRAEACAMPKTWDGCNCKYRPRKPAEEGRTPAGYYGKGPAPRDGRPILASWKNEILVYWFNIHINAWVAPGRSWSTEPDWWAELEAWK